METTCRLGALEFRLAKVVHQAMPAVDSRPFLLLPDGTEVRRTTQDVAPYLLVDHRSRFDGVARVEYWEAVSSPEAPLAGLITVCDALQSQY